MAHAFEKGSKIQGVSTGSVAVDYIAGNGGFPRGYVSEVLGLEQSGKSTLCMSACAKAQAMGLFASYIDVERSLDIDHAARLGFDVNQPGAWLKPNTFEETLVIIDTLAQQGKADIILTDSVPALVPEEVMKGPITQMGQFGTSARLFAGALPRLVKTVERTKTALVFVNQLRANITEGWQPPGTAKEKTFGGYALRYYSALRIQLLQLKKNARTRVVPHATKRGETEEQAVAGLHRAVCFKSKVAQPYQTIDFYIRFDPYNDLWGIDNLGTRIDIAMTRDIIQVKSGGHFVVTQLDGTPVAIHGADALYDWYAQRPAEVQALKQQIGL